MSVSDDCEARVSFIRETVSSDVGGKGNGGSAAAGEAGSPKDPGGAVVTLRAEEGRGKDADEDDDKDDDEGGLGGGNSCV